MLAFYFTSGPTGIKVGGWICRKLWTNLSCYSYNGICWCCGNLNRQPFYSKSYSSFDLKVPLCLIIHFILVGIFSEVIITLLWSICHSCSASLALPPLIRNYWLFLIRRSYLSVNSVYKSFKNRQVPFEKDSLGELNNHCWMRSCWSWSGKKVSIAGGSTWLFSTETKLPLTCWVNPSKERAIEGIGFDQKSPFKSWH